MSRRHSGEGSIYPVKDGYRGYVWCTNPAGERYRKYVKCKTYDETQRAWLKLRDQASRGPVASDVPSLEKFLRYWLQEIVQPNLAPKTYENTNCSPSCTSFPSSELSGSTSFRCRTSGSG
jgi:hypothetical protein